VNRCNVPRIKFTALFQAISGVIFLSVNFALRIFSIVIRRKCLVTTPEP
jgi:hypothetical protein